MADNTATNGAQENAMPALNALAQYCKDFSFENPNAPRSLQQQSEGPQINLQVNVNAKQLAEADFEVELTLEGSAKVGGTETLFAFELTYSGIFRVANVPADQIHPVVMIECPRLLFPFARQIVADAVRNGGFPPLYIDPIDFVALYRQRASELQTENKAGVTLS
ncbi:MAG: protein-export chaperone SecB [Microvirga sp.]|jgi:preprotein translocase subunit SecB|uniref:Protein-export protein SecB n=1 Tax=Microvirga brassicacearum TaxID=2580413 RepID=A0A5N3PE02_9HYPH|nr:protein-export chaperone SecB [Microvirga brassicacearum]KAB0267972.1 protein-export chaperone SecB [Microvirga brassicacearum]MDF2812258.1 protein-export chaperone SecB [Microvirga sp.]